MESNSLLNLFFEQHLINVDSMLTSMPKQHESYARARRTCMSVLPPMNHSFSIAMLATTWNNFDSKNLSENILSPQCKANVLGRGHSYYTFEGRVVRKPFRATGLNHHRLLGWSKLCPSTILIHSPHLSRTHTVNRSRTNGERTFETVLEKQLFSLTLLLLRSVRVQEKHGNAQALLG